MIALKNILVATDFGEASDAALRHGLELARHFTAALHVLHVAADLGASPQPPPSGMPLGMAQQWLEDEARDNLARLVPERDRIALNARTVLLTSSSAAATIVAYARDSAIDLVILGTHGRHGLTRLFLGSVAQEVTATCGCPVLTVRAHVREFAHADMDQVAAPPAM